MKFSAMRRLGLPTERTREERRRIREAGERLRVDNARLVASTERITEMQRRAVQSTIAHFLFRHARVQPMPRAERKVSQRPQTGAPLVGEIRIRRHKWSQ